MPNVSQKVIANVAAVLAGLGPPFTIQEIVKITGLSPTTVRRAVTQLASEGYVNKRFDYSEPNRVIVDATYKLRERMHHDQLWSDALKRVARFAPHTLYSDPAFREVWRRRSWDTRTGAGSGVNDDLY